MAKEIERKFLTVNDSYRALAIKSYNIEQGYISTDPCRTVRVRVKDDRAFLTIKGVNEGCQRDEWEFEIPVEDAHEMLQKLCLSTTLAKTRHIVPHGDLKWEVDEFRGSLEGLVLAEIELPATGYDIGELPGFIGAEVTGDPRYYNSVLVNASLSNILTLNS